MRHSQCALAWSSLWHKQNQHCHLAFLTCLWNFTDYLTKSRSQCVVPEDGTRSYRVRPRAEARLRLAWWGSSSRLGVSKNSQRNCESCCHLVRPSEGVAGQRSGEEPVNWVLESAIKTRAGDNWEPRSSTWDHDRSLLLLMYICIWVWLDGERDSRKGVLNSQHEQMWIWTQGAVSTWRQTPQDVSQLSSWEEGLQDLCAGWHTSIFAGKQSWEEEGFRDFSSNSVPRWLEKQTNPHIKHSL